MDQTFICTRSHLTAMLIVMAMAMAMENADVRGLQTSPNS